MYLIRDVVIGEILTAKYASKSVIIAVSTIIVILSTFPPLN
jgi:hypothetical protein